MSQVTLKWDENSNICCLKKLALLAKVKMRLFEKSSKHSEYDKKWKLRKTFFGTSILMNFIDMSREVHFATAK